jgi:type VII secretion effector (TIGR04197 family)
MNLGIYKKYIGEKAMKIGSNINSAFEHGGQISGKASGGEQSIQYAYESNLTAIENGKAQSEIATGVISSCKELIREDGENIKSLGEQFASFDREIAIKIK